MAENNNQNPRNNQSALFKRLTRLFSGPIVDYDRPAVIRGNRRDVTKYTFTSNTGREFKKKEYHNPFGDLTNKVLYNRNKQMRYTDFEQMEYMPEIASALDIYADEMTTHSSLSPMLRIDCPNEEIRAVLHSLYINVLNLEHNLFGWSRSMVKNGDFILYLDIDDRIGVKSVIPIPLREVERLEGEDPSNN